MEKCKHCGRDIIFLTVDGEWRHQSNSFFGCVGVAHAEPAEPTGPVPCATDPSSVTARHPNSARFHAILTELAELHDRKQADYGRGDDPFANVRASEEWGVRPWVGALIRLTDKVRRLQALATKGTLKNEAADDSLRDIAVYAVIALVLMEQEPE